MRYLWPFLELLMRMGSHNIQTLLFNKQLQKQLLLSNYKNNNNNNNNASNDNNRWTFIKALSSFLIRDDGVGFTVPILFFNLQKKDPVLKGFFDQPTMVASYSIHDVPSVLWLHNVLRQHHPFFCKERRVTLWLRRSPGEGNGTVMPRVKNEQSNFIQNEKSPLTFLTPTSLHPYNFIISNLVPFFSSPNRKDNYFLFLLKMWKSNLHWTWTYWQHGYHHI